MNVLLLLLKSIMILFLIMVGIFALTFVIACVIILIEEVIRVIKKGGKK